MSTLDIIARLQLKGEQFSSETGRAFADMKTRAASTAADVKRDFNSSFSEVQRIAEKALTMPNVKGGGLDLSAEISALKTSATEAERKAEVLRQLSVAQTNVALTAGAEAQALRLEADASSVASLAHERDAIAMRQRIVTMEAMQDELNKLGGVERGAVVSTNRLGGAMASLAPQLQDTFTQISMGANPLNVLAIQGGQAAGQMVYLEGKAGAFARFMMGPWGLALTGGALVVGAFWDKIVGANGAVGDAVQKLREHAREADVAKRAQDLFARSAEGVTAAVAESEEALRKAAEGERTAAETANINARATFNQAIAIRERTRARLEEARAMAAAEVDALRTRASGPGQRGENATLGLDAATSRLSSIEAQIAANESNVARASRAYQESRIALADETAKAISTAEGKINRAYDAQEVAARNRARAAARRGEVVTASLTKELAAINENRQAALKAAQDAERAEGRAASRNRQSGREITSAQASAIIRGIGGQVNSADQSTARQTELYAAWVAAGKPANNPVAKPGTSAHERGGALDVQFGNGMSPAKIRDAFEKEGVRITKVFAERGHWHIEWAQGAGARQAVTDATRKAVEEAKSTKALLDRVAAIGGIEGDGEFNRLQAASRSQMDRAGANARDILNGDNAGFDRVVDEWVEGMKRRAPDTAEPIVSAGEHFRDVVAGAADLFGIKVNGPMRALLQPGGIEGQAREVAEAVGAWAKTAGLRIDDKSIDRISGVLSAASYGQAGGSVFASITGGRENRLASGVGGIVGGEIGKMAGPAIAKTIGGALGKTLSGAAGPIGSIMGGVLGNVVGGLFKSTKKASSTISISGGEATAGAGVGSASLRGNAGKLGGSVADTLNQIAQQLGGELTAVGGVSIGQRDKKFVVDTTGRGRTKGAGTVRYDDEESAIRAAIAQQLRLGVVGGISDASRTVLAAGGDLEKAIVKAALIESVPRELKAMTDPLGAAIDELNRKFEKTKQALIEGGASAEQMAQAQQLYSLQLADVKANTASASAGLKDFLRGLKVGNDSPLSLRDQEVAAKSALQPFLDQIAGGQAVDQAKFQQAAQTVLDVDRQLYGSTSKFFETFDRIQAATESAIARIDNVTPITAAVKDPFAEKVAANTQAANELLAQLSDQAAGTNELLARLLANAGGGGGGGGFIGDARGFVSAL